MMQYFIVKENHGALFIETKIYDSLFKNSSSSDIITATFINNNLNSIDKPRLVIQDTIFTESNIY